MRKAYQNPDLGFQYNWFPIERIDQGCDSIPEVGSFFISKDFPGVFVYSGTEWLRLSNGSSIGDPEALANAIADKQVQVLIENSYDEEE